MPKADWGAGASGAVSGGISGFTAGGPIGGAVGAVTGGLAGLFGGKKKQKPKRISRLDPSQQKNYKDYIASLRGEGGPFNDLYNFDTQGANNNFDQNVSRPANRNFNENIIPGITGQFRGQNMMNSSYTGEALGRAGRDVQENLDAQRSNMIFNGQQGALDRKERGVKDFLNMQTFDYEKPEQSPMSGIMSTLGPQAANFLTDYLSKKGGGGNSMMSSSGGSSMMSGGNQALLQSAQNFRA